MRDDKERSGASFLFLDVEFDLMSCAARPSVSRQKIQMQNHLNRLNKPIVKSIQNGENQHFLRGHTFGTMAKVCINGCLLVTVTKIRSVQLVHITEQALVNRLVKKSRGSAIASGPLYWGSPPPSWVKINTDGARRGDDGYASRGVARDSSGTWMFGFLKFIGVCSVLDAELWGAYLGLYFAWNAGFQQVILQLDNMDALRILKVDYAGTHALSGHLFEFRRRAWCVKIRHISRSGNWVADVLAKGATIGSLEPQFFCSTARFGFRPSSRGFFDGFAKYFCLIGVFAYLFMALVVS
ncbi:hypothetical protein GQ457_07G000840 [Hibiscus cannabinus]